MTSEVCSLTHKNNPKDNFNACHMKGKKSSISVCWQYKIHTVIINELPKRMC